MYVLRKNLEFLQHGFSCEVKTRKKLSRSLREISAKFWWNNRFKNGIMSYLLSFWLSRELSTNCAIYLEFGLVTKMGEILFPSAAARPLRPPQENCWGLPPPQPPAPQAGTGKKRRAAAGQVGAKMM